MFTKHAPAEREDQSIIKQDHLILKDALHVKQLLNSLPIASAIINTKRQVVLVNEEMLKFMGVNDLEVFLGFRLGEIVNCIHAGKEEGGCGTSENCCVCGAVNTILKSQRLNQKFTSECRITSSVQEGIKAMDFQITIAPFELDGRSFYYLSLIDVSDLKRRRALERIFFHDLINKAGSMLGMVDLFKQSDNPDEYEMFIDLLDSISHDITNEIIYQRDLAAAESGDLKVSFTEQDSLCLVDIIVQQVKGLKECKGKDVVVDKSSTSIEVLTDGVVCRRVLLNMAKNAVEASNEDETVTLGCEVKGNNCRFYVHNNAVMPKEIQLQVFQRSFSTKGLSRGLGTYSIKLLGENYLKGKVSFVSNENEGTRFFLDLPLSNEDNVQ